MEYSPTILILDALLSKFGIDIIKELSGKADQPSAVIAPIHK